MTLEEIGSKSKIASRKLIKLSQTEKNNALVAVGVSIKEGSKDIISANAIDIENARKNGMPEAMIDRLTLDDARIDGIIEGLNQVVSLEDPIGEVLSMKKRPNGLVIGQKRVPIGVIGIIYESRPNVTVDAFALCFKTSNAVILRGGSDAINSNMALVKYIKQGLINSNVTADAIYLLEDTSRETATSMMKLNQYIDVLIPRGGAGLIKSVVENATIPVIETGTGNCHVFVDESADIDMAVSIIHNAKLQRLGVCNALESLVIHKNIADKAIPAIAEDLIANGCEIRGDEQAKALDSRIVAATKEDYSTEYLAKIISAKIVDNIDEAIEHINNNSTGHSESIITKDYDNANKFLEEVDSAAVYVNASTRFTDGFEFGFGAEIGISTQKLHARGPMGLLALTSTKYIIYGNGQIR